MTSLPDDSEKTVKAILYHWQASFANDRMAHLVKDAWRGLTRAFQVRLGEHSVLFGHWVFLRILWNKDGITQRELSLEAGLMPPTTFSAVKSMRRLGYVRCERDPANGRNVRVFLTPKGRALQRVLVPLAEEVNAIALRSVSANDVSTTRKTLLAMIKDLAEDELNLLKDKRKLRSTRVLANVKSVARRPRSPLSRRPSVARNRTT